MIQGTQGKKFRSKLQFSFAKEAYRDDMLPKRLIIIRRIVERELSLRVYLLNKSL